MQAIWQSMGVLLVRSNLRARFGARGLRREGDHFVAEHRIGGRTIQFAIRNPSDAIQRHHMVGVFYERSVLDMIARHCPPNPVFVDIGANVGNHTLFVATQLSPKRIHVFEPNPEAIATLKDNIELNDLGAVCDTSHLGVGVSDCVRGGMGVDFVPINLGGARLVEGGSISLKTGDFMLKGTKPDFVKIDVEGMEMKVLAGLQGTIARSKPAIFVEVHDANWAAFQHWLESGTYAIALREDHDGYRNILLLPARTPKREAPLEDSAPILADANN